MEIQSRLREEHSLQDVLFRDALKGFHVATSLWYVYFFLPFAHMKCINCNQLLGMNVTNLL